MGKFSSRPLADLAAVAVNAGINVSDLETADMWVTGTFVATAQVQLSPDNVSWIDEGAALTAPGRVSIPKAAKFVRVSCTAYTSGTVESDVTGVDDDQLG